MTPNETADALESFAGPHGYEYSVVDRAIFLLAAERLRKRGGAAAAVALVPNPEPSSPREFNIDGWLDDLDEIDPEIDEPIPYRPATFALASAAA